MFIGLISGTDWGILAIILSCQFLFITDENDDFGHPYLSILSSVYVLNPVGNFPDITLDS